MNYTYDKLNRVTSEDYTGQPGTEVSYSYDTGTDGKGRLSQVAFQNNATTTFTYNPLGGVFSVAKKIGSVSATWGTTTTTYLRNGAIESITYPDASQVAYLSDDAGLLEKVTNKEPSIATSIIISSMTYSPTGALAVISYGNGMISTSAYDQTKNYRLVGKQTTGSTTLQNIAYSYDVVGNITTLSDLASTSARKTVNYTYDPLYRLLSASTTAVATNTTPYLQSWSYDNLGNILTAPSGSYTYSGTGYANPDAVTLAGGVGYTYDQSGNLLTYGSTTNTWDYHNYLTQSVVKGGSVGGSIATATPAFVQAGLNSTSSSVTFSTPVATGNLILVGLTNWNTAIPAGSITDNKGNTYTKVAEVINATADHLALFYAKNVSGGSSFTVTSSADGTISAHEYSGISTSSPLDKVASSTGSSGTSLSSGNVTPAVAGELIFGLAWSELDGSSWTAGTGYTLRTQETNNATAERSASEDRIATNTNAIATTFTVGGSAPWTALIATFKPLVTVTGGTSTPSATSTYLYDQGGNRVQLTDTSSTGTTTSYWGSTYQQTPGGYKKTKNIYVNGQLVATLEKTGTNTMIPYYIATDHLGGTSVVTNASGVATETLDYFPYGAIRRDDKATSFSENRKYIGQTYDDATSLSYLQNRYYSGDNAKFLSQDPVSRDVGLMKKQPWHILNVNKNMGDIDQEKFLSNPQMLNSYAYALNNPINMSDPSGLCVGMFECTLNTLSFGKYDQTTDSLADAAGQLSADSPAWRFGMDHPIISGAAIGVLSGTGARSAFYGLMTIPSIFAPGVGAEYIFGRAIITAYFLNSAQSRINGIGILASGAGSAPSGSSPYAIGQAAISPYVDRVVSVLQFSQPGTSVTVTNGGGGSSQPNLNLGCQAYCTGMVGMPGVQMTQLQYYMLTRNTGGPTPITK